ncbi:hypothetical protein HY480_01660 [Candidatus Uhrbacteria bacterium]|nr:hypothetical protein [Candidatus Uhrbacteria bacterium]
MRYLIALIGIAVGFLVVWKSEWFFEQFGTVSWAELNLSGGTRFFYKLVGLGIILASLLFMSGVIQSILTFVFVPKNRSI